MGRCLARVSAKLYAPGSSTVIHQSVVADAVIIYITGDNTQTFLLVDLVAEPTLQPAQSVFPTGPTTICHGKNDLIFHGNDLREAAAHLSSFKGIHRFKGGTTA